MNLIVCTGKMIAGLVQLNRLDWFVRASRPKTVRDVVSRHEYRSYYVQTILQEQDHRIIRGQGNPPRALAASTAL
ncbi:MAG: hypothetical protein U5O39_10195 [Gammaproteobacteria bacterium]|nr:hypothetical protein [Gammaproteobacteria bacterium]